jgi:hypothetical protein
MVGRVGKGCCCLVQAFEGFGLIMGDEGHDYLVQRTRHNLLNLIDCQANAVVCDPTLRKVVGADALAAIAGAYS